MYAKYLRIEPFEIYFVIIQYLICELKQIKNIVRNLASRSCEIKVCEAKTGGKNSYVKNKLGFFQRSFY